VGSGPLVEPVERGLSQVLGRHSGGEPDGISGVTDLLHDDEIPIDLNLVRALVDRAFPGYASLSLRRLGASGSSNALFRLGDELLVRLPRQPGGTATIEKEARWIPQMASLLPVSLPEIVAVGESDLGYPERWSIVRWLDGYVPSVVTDADTRPARHELAADLAAVVRALRNIDLPASALGDPDLHWYRGLPITSRDIDTRCAIEACRAIPGLGLDLDTALEVWEESMALPEPEQRSAPRWYHGDLFAENLLVQGGRLTAVLDFGGLGVGDPTVDLLPAWQVLDPDSRAEFRQAVGVDQDSWLRGRAWALSLAVGAFPYYWRTMPERCARSLAMVRAVIADARFGQR